MILAFSVRHDSGPIGLMHADYEGVTWVVVRATAAYHRGAPWHECGPSMAPASVHRLVDRDGSAFPSIGLNGLRPPRPHELLNPYKWNADR
jgi:hypothetical protein